MVKLTLTVSGKVADYPESVLSTLQQKIASASLLDESGVTVSPPLAAGASVLITALVAIGSANIELLDELMLDATEVLGVPVEKATYRPFDLPVPQPRLPPPPPPPPPSTSEDASGLEPMIIVFIVIGSLIVTCCAIVTINVFCIPTSRLAQMHEAGKAGVAEFKAGRSPTLAITFRNGRVVIEPVTVETPSSTGI